MRAVCGLLGLLLLAACASAGQSQPPPAGGAVSAAGDAVDFRLPAPDTSALPATRVWSTAYIAYLAASATGTGSVALLAPDGAGLGVSVSQRDWCHAAMEGTVSVQGADGGFRTFNFAGTGNAAQTDCRAVFPNVSEGVLAGTNRVRWKPTPPDAPYGLGVMNFRLVPLRSIAVDPSVFPNGTVLFIPRLRGATMSLPDGRQVQHDGFVFAADRGGAIKGQHIDFFKGPARSDAVPPALASDESHPIPAHTVSDPPIVAALRALHQR